MRLVRALFKTILAFILIGLFSFLLVRFLIEPSRFRAALGDMFGIDAASDYQVFTLEKKPLLELATLNVPVLLQGSTGKSSALGLFSSTVDYQALYNAKIGFDLQEFSAYEFNWLSNHAIVRLPQPKVLSIEQKWQKVRSDQSKLVPITPEEQAKTSANMQAIARRIASNADSLKQATAQFKKELELIATSNGGTVTIIVDQPSTVNDHEANDM